MNTSILILIRFNSMKVRLKPLSNNSDYKSQIGFNSMKVRLKPIGSQHLNGHKMFQFHEGPIKTKFRPPC